MEAKNMLWDEARRLGLKIVPVGKAYVALKGETRYRIYWYGDEATEALTWLNSASGRG